jgi:acyl-CoA thioesterase II
VADRRAGDRPVTAPVVDWLTLADRGGDTFEGHNPPEGGPDRPGAGRVFGGLVVGQALVAAQRTVLEPDRGVHAVHASFLRAGRADRMLRYAVERTRDGGAFTSRRVVASQEGEPILVLVASFQADEPGPEYQPGPPLAPGGSEGAGSDGLPPPDGLPPGRYDGAAFDCRDVPVGAGPPGPAHVRRMWFRARGRLTDDPALHRAALAMASDHGPTRAVRQPHADHPGVEQRHSVSLDHSVWLHRPARVDQWLLSELWPVSTSASRGLCLGTISTTTGELVATVAQEALLRLPG